MNANDPKSRTLSLGSQMELVKNLMPLLVIADHDCQMSTAERRKKRNTTQPAARAQMPRKTRSPKLGILNHPNAAGCPADLARCVGGENAIECSHVGQAI